MPISSLATRPLTNSPAGGAVSTPPATLAADVAPVPHRASAAALPPAISAEIIRLHDAGMGVDKIGARFRIPYNAINRIVERERARRTANAAAREYEGW
jgi:hypothetical protein